MQDTLIHSDVLLVEKTVAYLCHQRGLITLQLPRSDGAQASVFSTSYQGHLLMLMELHFGTISPDNPITLSFTQGLGAVNSSAGMGF